VNFRHDIHMRKNSLVQQLRVPRKCKMKFRIVFSLQFIFIERQNCEKKKTLKFRTPETDFDVNNAKSSRVAFVFQAIFVRELFGFFYKQRIISELITRLNDKRKRNYKETFKSECHAYRFDNVLLVKPT